MGLAACVPLVEGTREAELGTKLVETLHYGAICIKTGLGEDVATLGDPSLLLPLRSTAKPFQLLPFLLDRLHRSGARSQELASLAVMMSSHNGEPMHTERIEALLREHHLSPEHLQCGAHPPIHGATQRALLRWGMDPTALHSNCSGKHANMLIVCKHRGWTLADYLDPTHPLQQRIAQLVRHLAALAQPPSYVIDGCSLPSWVTSLADLASLYSRLALPEASPEVEGRSIEDELELCFRAGVHHPEMIAGSGRLDTELMRAYAGRVFAKTGADGVYAAAVKPSPAYPQGLAIAAKIADGDPNSQIRALVMVETLKQLALLPGRDAPCSLEKVARTELMNYRGRRVGELRTVFRVC